VLISSRLTLVHCASRGIGFPFESGSRIELLGLLPYALRLDAGEVPYCEGEAPNCGGSGAKVVLGLEVIDRGTRSSTDEDEFLGSMGELEEVYCISCSSLGEPGLLSVIGSSNL
jgi:hypothetical protein